MPREQGKGQAGRVGSTAQYCSLLLIGRTWCINSSCRPIIDSCGEARQTGRRGGGGSGAVEGEATPARQCEPSYASECVQCACVAVTRYDHVGTRWSGSCRF